MPKRALPEEPESPRQPYSPIRTIAEVEADTIGKGNNEISRRLALHLLRRQAKKRAMRTTEPEICRRNYQFIKSRLEVVERADAAAASQALETAVQQASAAPQQAQQQAQQAQQQAQETQQSTAAQLVQLQNEVAQLKNEKAALELEKSTLAREKAALTKDNKDLGKQKRNLEKEKAELREDFVGQYQELKSKHEESIKENKKLTRKLDKVSKEHEEMDEELGKANDRLADYEARERLNGQNVWEDHATALEAAKVVSDEEIRELKRQLAAWTDYGRVVKEDYRMTRSRLKQFDKAFVRAYCPRVGNDASEGSTPTDDERSRQGSQEVDDQNYTNEQADDDEAALPDYEYYEQQDEQHYRATSAAPTVLGQSAPIAPMVNDDSDFEARGGESDSRSEVGEAEEQEENEPVGRPTSRKSASGNTLRY